MCVWPFFLIVQRQVTPICLNAFLLVPTHTNPKVTRNSRNYTNVYNVDSAPLHRHISFTIQTGALFLGQIFMITVGYTPYFNITSLLSILVRMLLNYCGSKFHSQSMWLFGNGPFESDHRPKVMNDPLHSHFMKS